ncbi:tRNA dimethylallyltransferase 2 isoform X2 [Prunus persica]|uniref:tRNA dimethylallyltransferase 2 isoform X2 n=1 Tax=Prunus persica TaxID=3760 RepID=UPI0009AB70E9|nr:tRNA dimethylallyltransferase 2 isoform X2 [Prunus persica]
MERGVASIETQRTQNPGPNEEKPKVVVIMGPTGSGKSKLAIDLASYFPIEVINADSMQVYNGLDVLTNKVPLHEQKGVPHHLLGTVSPNVEFTAKDFRDFSIPLIDDILSRNCLPVIVGGTNYYIQALVSPFLLDDTVEDMDESYIGDQPGDGEPQADLVAEVDSSSYNYDHLKGIDPIAANRIHPNNHRKISQYLSLYAHHGVLPSQLLQGKAAEVYYTRGLRQAIGVREFEIFLRAYITEANDEAHNLIDESMSLTSVDLPDKILKENMRVILKSISDSQPKIALNEAIDKMKMNTRRLVRRQKRRINRLEALFGWNIHFLDATKFILCKSDDTWAAEVVGPAVEMIRSFLNRDASSVPDLDTSNSSGMNVIQRDLWAQYTCKACGDKILRGAHEWEQHKQGRGHRKRISRLKKSQGFFSMEQQRPPQHRGSS